MRTILTFDPGWNSSDGEKYPPWSSTDTLERVFNLLTDLDCDTDIIPAYESLDAKLGQRDPSNTLLYWLNEKTNAERGSFFTVELAERYNIPHTGPGSQALRMGLDKVITKKIFQNCGLLTPEYYLCEVGDYESISKNKIASEQVIVKPLLQGGSRGISKHSVIDSADLSGIGELVAEIWGKFNEPAYVEQFIGSDSREFSVPILVHHSDNGTYFPLPIVEMDLSQIPEGRPKILAQDVKEEVLPGKQENLYATMLKIPAGINPKQSEQLSNGMMKCANYMGLKDVTRTDVRSSGEGKDMRFYFIEINSNPDKSELTTVSTSLGHLGITQDQIYMLPVWQAMKRYEMDIPDKLSEFMEPLTKFSYVQESN